MDKLLLLINYLGVLLNPGLIEPVPKLINEVVISQSRVDRVFSKYGGNTQLPNSKLVASNSDLINYGFHNVGGDSEYWSRDGSSKEEYIMMASTSKFATTIVGVIRAKPKVRINLGVIRELLYRQPKRILQEPTIYNPILKDKFGLTKSEINGLANYSSNYGATLTKMAAKEGKISYTLPIKELLYHDLTLSSNTAAEVIKNLAIGKDSPELAQAKINQYLLIPNYELTISIGGITHWRQSASNTGKLSEQARLIHRFVSGYSRGSLNEKFEQVVSSIVNNKQDFDFDFTNSKLGKELKSDGWSIAEKTGYYPVVYWIIDLANGKRGDYPTHMTFSTIVSLIPPERMKSEPITFSYYRNIEVVAPPGRVTDVSTGLSVPNDYVPSMSPNYIGNYLDKVRRREAKAFRTELQIKVNSILNLDKESEKVQIPLDL